MDHTAIQEINDQASAKALNEQLKGTDLIVIPRSHEKHDTLLDEGARRYFRGAYHTNNLTNFLKYIDEHEEGNPNAELFIDRDKMKAVAFFDLKDHDGTPRTAEHQAHYVAIETPEYKAINALLHARQMDQRDLVDFAEEWGDIFTFIDTQGNPIEIKKAITSMRNMKVTANAEDESTVGDMAQSRSRTANIEAKGKDVTIGGFTGEIKLYEDLAPQTIKVKFRLHTGGDEITVTAKMMNRDRILDAVANDLASKIEDASEIETYLGTFKP